MMTDKELRLTLFAVRVRSHERPDLTYLEMIRDLDLKLMLGLQEGEVQYLYKQLITVQDSRKLKPSEILETLDRWTDHGYAQNGLGRECDPHCVSADRWSLQGVLDLCNIRDKRALEQMLDGTFMNMAQANKELGYVGVMALLRSCNL